MRAREILSDGGQQAAENYLTSRRYQILDRDWQHPDGTPAIVVADRKVLVVCKVKTRSGAEYQSPLEAVGSEERGRLRDLAAAWMPAHGVRFEQVRIDVLGLVQHGTGGFTIEHIEWVG